MSVVSCQENCHRRRTRRKETKLAWQMDPGSDLEMRTGECPRCDSERIVAAIMRWSTASRFWRMSVIRGLGSSADKGRRRCKWIDLQRHAFDLELMGNDLCDQFLFKLANIDKSDADACVFKTIKGFAAEAADNFCSAVRSPFEIRRRCRYSLPSR